MKFNKSNYIRLLRRLVQIASVCLMIYIIWSTRFPLKNFLSPEVYFLIDPLAMYITAIAERVLLPGLIFSSILMALTFVLGRAFCGWICPLGALFDLWVTVKRPFMKLRKKRYLEKTPSRLRFVKFAFLGSIFIAAIFGIQLAWIFDPITIFVRTFSFNLHPAISAAIDRGFMHLLEATDYHQSVESLYTALREGFLNLSAPQFPHTKFILIFFFTLLLLALVRRRFWCRYLCPLGATLALPGRFPLLRRDVRQCTRNCGMCKNQCRMNAIKKDNTYLPGECILCLDCMAVCPGQNSTFRFKRTNSNATSEESAGGSTISRSVFLASLAGFFLSATGYPEWAERVGMKFKYKRRGTEAMIRPPGALPEEEFIQRCIRCGNCMKICPTNVLQPSLFEYGLDGTWTPIMNTSIGYCEYPCNLCGRVCPTDAINELTVKKKQKKKIGIAVINHKLCLPYSKGENCIVCEEHCPIEDKAIKLKNGYVKGKPVKLPVVDKKLCIGCVICENKCPTEPERSIRIWKVDTA